MRLDWMGWDEMGWDEMRWDGIGWVVVVLVAKLIQVSRDTVFFCWSVLWSMPRIRQASNDRM